METFELTPPPVDSRPVLYSVRLRGAPEIFSAKRASLEQQFRAALNAQFPNGEEGAWACIAAEQDGSADDNCAPPCWNDAERIALSALDARLPPGAHFECTLSWTWCKGSDAPVPGDEA